MLSTGVQIFLSSKQILQNHYCILYIFLNKQITMQSRMHLKTLILVK